MSMVEMRGSPSYFSARAFIKRAWHSMNAGSSNMGVTRANLVSPVAESPPGLFMNFENFAPFFSKTHSGEAYGVPLCEDTHIMRNENGIPILTALSICFSTGSQLYLPSSGSRSRQWKRT